MYFAKHVGYTWIEAGVVLTMNEIMLLEVGKTTGKIFGRSTIGHRLFNEATDTIANKTAHFVEGTLWPPHLRQGIVGTITEILQCIGKRTIKVKDNGTNRDYRFHKPYFTKDIMRLRYLPMMSNSRLTIVPT